MNSPSVPKHTYNLVAPSDIDISKSSPAANVPIASWYKFIENTVLVPNVPIS
jgi:hypothetical protein